MDILSQLISVYLETNAALLSLFNFFAFLSGVLITDALVCGLRIFSWNGLLPEKGLCSELLISLFECKLKTRWKYVCTCVCVCLLWLAMKKWKWKRVGVANKDSLQLKSREDEKIHFNSIQKILFNLIGWIVGEVCVWVWFISIVLVPRPGSIAS